MTAAPAALAPSEVPVRSSPVGAGVPQRGALAPNIPESGAVALGIAAQALRHRRERSVEHGYGRYLDDPVGFICGPLSEELWSKQREIAEAVRDHRHVAVRSAHDTGKSFIAARIAAWWLSVHEPGEAFVVTTAPTFAQVRAILWREIHRAHLRGHLPGRVNQTEWWIDGEIVAYGRKPADYDDHAFQGIHARYVLVILDEACGIPRSLWTAVETLATNEHSRVLAIGNPDSPLSQFRRVCEDGSGWHVIHVDGLASPNFSDEPVSDSLRELLLSRTWVEERRDDWGEDSALWSSKVRGRFPAVPVGQVYKELSASQQWYGELPTFSRIVGGADVGGANDAAHMTSGVIAGVVARQPDGTRQTAPAGSLIRFAHFEDAGANVHDRFVDWLRGWEQRLERRVELRMDKTQMFGISMLQQQGFQVLPSHGGADSVWMGINLQRRRMADGTSFFTEELTKPPPRGGTRHPSQGGGTRRPSQAGGTRRPSQAGGTRHPSQGGGDGQPALGKSWFERMTNLRWAQPPDGDRATPGVPIKRDDDTPDADRYMHEAVDGFPAARGPSVSNRTLSGRKRARSAV